MHDLPEPAHDLVVGAEALIVSVLLERLKVKLWQATDAQLELFWAEKLERKNKVVRTWHLSERGRREAY